MIIWLRTKKKNSLPGSRTQLSRVTGACTNRYTSKDGDWARVLENISKLKNIFLSGQRTRYSFSGRRFQLLVPVSENMTSQNYYVNMVLGD